jgi:hypothetical protein
MTDPTLAFVADDGIRVNFGVYAGRAATPAEIDRLATWLLDEVDGVSIVAEERHEIDGRGEAVVHQLRIQAAANEPAQWDRILERVEHWTRLCVAERHAEVTDGA